MTLLPPPTATTTATESGVWHFDDFVLDRPRFLLQHNGVAIGMEPQVFDVMVMLVSNHHRMVTKNELLDAVWGGRFVSEAALTSRIKAARRALGDDGRTQRYIRTIRGRGYQFVGGLADRQRSGTHVATVSAAAPAPEARILLPGLGDRPEVLARLALAERPHYRYRGRGLRRYGRPAPSTRRRVFHGPPR